MKVMGSYVVVKEIGGRDGLDVAVEMEGFSSIQEATEWIGDWNEIHGSLSCGLTVWSTQDVDAYFTQDDREDG